MKKIGVFLAKWGIFNGGITIIVYDIISVINNWNKSMAFGNSILNVAGMISLLLLGIIVIIIGLVI
jgi:hypothetical protein